MNKYVYLAIYSAIITVVIVIALYTVNILNNLNNPNNPNNLKRKDLILFLVIFLVIFIGFVFFDKKFLKDYIAKYHKEDIRRLYNTIWANGI